MGKLICSLETMARLRVYTQFKRCTRNIYTVQYQQYWNWVVGIANDYRPFISWLPRLEVYITILGDIYIIILGTVSYKYVAVNDLSPLQTCRWDKYRSC